MTTERIEYRCPRNPRKMFGILYRNRSWSVAPDFQPTPLSTLEFACQDCTQDLRKHGLVVARVLHRFHVDGTFIRTEHVPMR